jgi:hypothetical protein
MKRDPDKDRAWRQRGVKRYRENLAARARKGEVQSGLTRGSKPLPRRAQPTTGLRLWVRATKRCAVRTCRRPNPDPHHDPARKMGRSADPWAEDEGAVIPFCREHHQEVHQKGPQHFRAVHGVNLDRVKAALWMEWESLPEETRKRWEGRAYRRNKKVGASPARRPR